MFQTSGFDTIAQAVINPTSPPSVAKSYGFKAGGITEVVPGALLLQLNPDMNYAAQVDRQVLVTLVTPAGTAVAYHAQVLASPDPQTIAVSIFDAAGATITLPPNGSQLCVTVVRAGLPQP